MNPTNLRATYVVLINFAILCSLNSIIGQQCNPTDDLLRDSMPWTYFSADQLPECYPNDSAWLKRAFEYEEGKPHPRIRYVFRVYHHPERLPDDVGAGGAGFSIEVPRDPNIQPDTIRFTRSVDATQANLPGITSTLALDPVGYDVGSMSMSFVDQNFDPDRPEPDTFYINRLSGLPGNYDILDGLPSNRRWGFFIQYLHPTYHPPIVPVEDAYYDEPPAPFPSPAGSAVSIAAPPSWTGSGTITLYSAVGLAVDSVMIDNFLDGPVQINLGDLSPGTYVAQLRLNQSPRWSSASFVKK